VLVWQVGFRRSCAFVTIPDVVVVVVVVVGSLSLSGMACIVRVSEWSGPHGMARQRTITFSSAMAPMKGRQPLRDGQSTSAHGKKKRLLPFHNKNDAQFLYQLDRERHSENVRTQE